MQRRLGRLLSELPFVDASQINREIIPTGYLIQTGRNRVTRLPPALRHLKILKISTGDYRHQKGCNLISKSDVKNFNYLAYLDHFLLWRMGGRSGP